MGMDDMPDDRELNLYSWCPGNQGRIPDTGLETLQNISALNSICLL